MKPAYFWGSAILVAVAFGGLVGFVFPFEAVGLETAADRRRGWLLIVWTAGVLALCFGATGLLGALTPIGFRDVAEAGSVPAAIAAHRDSRRQMEVSRFYNFAGWTVSVGTLLILIYFAGWLLTGA